MFLINLQHIFELFHTIFLDCIKLFGLSWIFISVYHLIKANKFLHLNETNSKFTDMPSWKKLFRKSVEESCLQQTLHLPPIFWKIPFLDCGGIFGGSWRDCCSQLFLWIFEISFSLLFYEWMLIVFLFWQKKKKILVKNFVQKIFFFATRVF